MKDFLNKIDFREANACFLLLVGLISLPFIVRKTLRKGTATYLKLIPAYIFFIVLQLGIANYFVFRNTHFNTNKNPTNISAYVFTIIEYCIFAIFLSKFIKLPIVKKYLIVSCIIFIAIGIITWYSIPSFYRDLTIITNIETVSLIPFCLFYFFELLNNPPFLKLTEEPAFWITTGILFLFICITPFYLAFHYFRKIPEMQVIDYFGYDLIILFFVKASFTKPKTSNG